MKIKSICAAAALCIAAAGSHGAPGSFDMSTGSGTFENTITSNDPFIDLFTFSLLTPVTDFVSAVFSLTSGSKNIDFFVISLSGGSLGSSEYYSKIFGDPVEVWSLTLGSLGSGSYTVAVVGTKFGTDPVDYFGSMSVTPVPEPGTMAMLMAGLGVMGWVIRRRLG